MYVHTVKLSIKPECVTDFIRELLTLRARIVEEPDCLRFEVLQDADQPGQILLYELWTSREYFEREQLKRGYYVPYFDRVIPMWAQQPLRENWFVISV